MTATLSPDARSDALTAKLAALQAEREQTLAEIAPAGFGDDADRATNVDGHVRLAMLEQRIAAVEAELAEQRMPHHAQRTSDGTVAVGDVVTVDLGDGPETYLFGSVEQAVDDLDVITPSSPLGRVLEGAKAGTTLSYNAGRNRVLKAQLIAIS